MLRCYYKRLNTWVVFYAINGVRPEDSDEGVGMQGALLTCNHYTLSGCDRRLGVVKLNTYTDFYLFHEPYIHHIICFTYIITDICIFFDNSCYKAANYFYC